jgi:O-antigen/teichoic acid export membrane protein
MILGFVITFGFTSGIIAQPFCVWNMQKEFGNSILWGNILNTLLNFTLIPFMGAIGAALATLAAKLIVTVVAYVYFRKVTDYPIVKDFAYFFAASIIPLLFVYIASFITTIDLILIPVYGVIYLLLVAVMYKKYFSINMKPLPV